MDTAQRTVRQFMKVPPKLSPLEAGFKCARLRKPDRCHRAVLMYTRDSDAVSVRGGFDTTDAVNMSCVMPREVDDDIPSILPAIPSMFCKALHVVLTMRMLSVAILIQTMAEEGMPLLIHGEVTTPGVDIFDKEATFIEEVIKVGGMFCHSR